MPTIYISMNLNLKGVNLDPLLNHITQSLSSILHRPTQMVMMVVKGSTEIWFAWSKEPTMFTELLFKGEINKAMNKELISTVFKFLSPFPTTGSSIKW